MNTESNPLQALMVGEEALADQELADTLMPYVRFTEGAEFLLDPAFERLSSPQSVLCVLLAARALHALGKRLNSELRSKEIIELTGMPDGTVHSAVKQLKESRLIKKGEKGGWEIPNHALRKVVISLAQHEEQK